MAFMRSRVRLPSGPPSPSLRSVDGRPSGRQADRHRLRLALPARLPSGPSSFARAFARASDGKPSPGRFNSSPHSCERTKERVLRTRDAFLVELFDSISSMLNVIGRLSHSARACACGPGRSRARCGRSRAASAAIPDPVGAASSGAVFTPWEPGQRESRPENRSR